MKTIKILDNAIKKIDEINNHMLYDLLKKRIELLFDYIYLPILAWVYLLLFMTDDIKILVSLIILEIFLFFTIYIVKKKMHKVIKRHEITTYYIFKEQMPYTIFEYLIKDIDRKKYHIFRELDENGYIKKWVIYKKAKLTPEEFFSPKNKPILSSNKNNFLDLIDFVENQKEYLKRGKKNARNNKGNKK